MRDGQPSQTARGAAAYRAIHQQRKVGAIFKDPLASRILDVETAAALDEIAANDSLRSWRLFITARSRFSEDAMGDSIACGVRQVVVLGAGLIPSRCEILMLTSAFTRSRSTTLRPKCGSAIG